MTTPAPVSIVRYGRDQSRPQGPLLVPMDDGYWTPWHIADAEVTRLRIALTARDRVLQQCEAALAGAVMGKPVMLGPVLTEVRAILAGVRT